MGKVGDRVYARDEYWRIGCRYEYVEDLFYTLLKTHELRCFAHTTINKSRAIKSKSLTSFV